MSSTESPSFFVTPQTPPRPERRRSNPSATPLQSNHLLTPSTATKKQIKSPVTIRRKQDALLVNKFPFTPATPQKSPCKSRKNLDLFTSNEKFGILLPSPSTIGSGRCHNSISQGPPPPPVFDMKKLNEFKVPATPRKQVINEPKLPEEDSDEDDWEITTMSEVDKIPRAKLTNPFVDNGEHKHIAPVVPDNGINYDTHMELINNRTGKKRIVKLTKNQMKIKPKKLSFEGI